MSTEHVLTAHVHCIQNMDKFYSDINKKYSDQNYSIIESFFSFSLLNMINPYNKFKLKETWVKNIFANLSYKNVMSLTSKLSENKNKFFGPTFADKLGNSVKDFYKSKYKSFKHDFDKSDIVFAEKVIIKDTNPKIYFIGDIHGSLWALFYVLHELMTVAFKDTTSFILKKDCYLIFLGDIVDYTFMGFESLAFVFILLLLNPNNVFIVNGNHEDRIMYKDHEFGKELKQFGSSSTTVKFWHKLLHNLPSVIYLNVNNKWYHCSHGAFDYDFGMNGTESELTKFLKSNSHFVKVNSNDQISQFKWGDFYQTELYTQIMKPPNSNSRSHFTPLIVNAYLNKNNIECIISGHQDMIHFAFIAPNPQMVKSEFALESILEQGGYDLYTNKTTYQNCTKNEKFQFKPKQDLLACVTSVAVQAKSVPRVCYLTLTNNGMVGGSNTLNKDKYIKYKQKYKKLKNQM